MAQNSTRKLEEDVRALVEKALMLVEATEGLSDPDVTEARTRLQADLEKYRQTYGTWRERFTAPVKRVDQAVKDHPYGAMGVALGAGTLLGLYFVGSRRG